MPLVLWAASYKDRSWSDSLAMKPVALKAVGFWLLVYCDYLPGHCLKYSSIIPSAVRLQMKSALATVLFTCGEWVSGV
jgi:hypothetical protein